MGDLEVCWKGGEGLSQEKKPFIPSKTVWFISEIIKARTQEAILKHLLEAHNVPIPNEAIEFYNNKTDQLEQSFAEYRQKKEG